MALLDGEDGMEDTFPGSDHDLGMNDSDSEEEEGWNTETCKQLTTAGMYDCYNIYMYWSIVFTPLQLHYNYSSENIV